MQRTQISLTALDRKILDRESARSGHSIAHLIRIAISATYGDVDNADEDLTRLRQSFGTWRSNSPGGEEYVEGVRSGSRLRPPRP